MPRSINPARVQGCPRPGRAEHRERVPRSRGPLLPPCFDFFPNAREGSTAFCPNGEATGSIELVRCGFRGIRHRPCRHSIVSSMRRVVAVRAPGSGRTLVRGLICCFHQSLQIQWSLLWELNGISCNSCSVGHLSIRPAADLQGPRRRGAPIEWSWAQGPSGEGASPWPFAMFTRFVKAPFTGWSLVIRIVGVPSRRFRFQCPLMLGH